MKRLILATMLCALALPAFAADQSGTSTEAAKPSVEGVISQQSYLPFVIEAADYQSLMTYLNAQPVGVANPIINFLGQKEQAAQATSASEKAGKKP